MIAYFLASILWLVTSCVVATCSITLFSFAFELDLVNGSQATGGAGALAPVSQRDPRRSTPTSSASPGSSSRSPSPAVGDVEGAGAAPLLRDGGRARALADLRRRSRCSSSPSRERPSAASRSGRTRCRGRSCRSRPSGIPSSARQAKEDAADELFEPAHLQALGRPQLRRPRTLRPRRHRLADSDPESVAVRPLSSNPAGTPRSPVASRPGPRSPPTARSASTTRTSTRRASSATA